MAENDGGLLGNQDRTDNPDGEQNTTNDVHIDVHVEERTADSDEDLGREDNELFGAPDPEPKEAPLRQNKERLVDEDVTLPATPLVDDRVSESRVIRTDATDAEGRSVYQVVVDVHEQD